VNWQSYKEQKLEYIRRDPSKTELYQITYHHHEELEHQWENRFQQQFGAFRGVVKTALNKYLSCGILAHGAARAKCTKCNHSKLIAFSCKCRGFCPSCGTKRSLIFANVLTQSILKPVPHKHIIFSIPKRLRPYFRYDRKLNSILFQSAAKSIKILYKEIYPDSTPAFVLTVQTAGDALNFNPHLHGIIANGVFNKNDSFTRLSLNTNKLNELFAHFVLKALLDRELINSTVVQQITNQTHSGFSVWFGDNITPEDSKALAFISSYIDRNPVTNDKIKLADNSIKYLHNSDFLAIPTFDSLQFLATLSAHIPNKYEQTVRYYGYYSARTRGKRRKCNSDSKQVITDSDAQKPNKAWAALIAQVYEVDPLICQKCNSPMKIIAFIFDFREIDKILDNLNLPKYHPPPPLNFKNQQNNLNF